jgi:cell division septal protein FtsQ
MRNDRGNPTAYEVFGDAALQAPLPLAGEPYAAPGYPLVPSARSNKAIIRLAVFLAVVSVILILLQLVFFRLKTVYVVGNESIAADYIVSLSGLSSGDSIFSVTEAKVRDQLKADHWIVLEHVYKRYPNEVYLFVDEREIVASMQWLGIEYTMDIDGMVLEEYSDMNYEGQVPTVYGFKVTNAVAGEFLSVHNNAQLTAYSAIVSELTIQRYADHVVSINVGNPDSLSLLTTDGITVQLGNGDYMRAKIGAMRTDLAYLQQLGEASGVLDVTVPEDGKFRRE